MFMMMVFPPLGAAAGMAVSLPLIGMAYGVSLLCGSPLSREACEAIFILCTSFGGLIGFGVLVYGSTR
jgi:hypothetical protein